MRMYADTRIDRKLLRYVFLTVTQNVPVAQRIRRETTNLKIAGSNPVGDTTKIFSPIVLVLWCNWLSLWTLNPAIRVQIPVEPA